MKNQGSKMKKQTEEEIEKVEPQEFEWANVPRKKKDDSPEPPSCELGDDECLSCGA